MGVLDTISNILSSDKNLEDTESQWNPIESTEDIDSIFESSKEETQIVFKHSSSCAVSFFAMKSLNTPELLDNPEVDLHLIDVIRKRSESLHFAEKVNISHESPQIFIIKNKKVVWSGSHKLVNAKNILSNI